MNWIKTVNQIKNKLEDKGLTSSCNRILDAQMILGTPGEMYLEIINVLLDWKNNNTEEYQLIRKETEELLNYGRSINYF